MTGSRCVAAVVAVLLSACSGGAGDTTTPDTPPPPLQPDNRAHVRGLDCTAPDSAGWCWQQPQPGSVAMLDTHFTDADHGWAVGENGTVHRTADGGLSWSRRFIGAEGLLRAVRFADAQTGWILGEEGSWFTRDGGTSWTRTPPPPLPSLGRTWVQPDGRVLVSPDTGASSFVSLTYTATPQQPQWQPVPMWVSLVTQPATGVSTWHGVIVDAQSAPQRHWGRSTDNGARFAAQTMVDNGLWLLGIGSRGVGAALWAQVAEPLIDPVTFDVVGYRRNQLVLSGDDGGTWGAALELPTDTMRTVIALRPDGRGAARPWVPNLAGRDGPSHTLEVTADGGRSWTVPRTPDGSAARALADEQWLLQAVPGSRPWLSSDLGASWTAIDALPATPERLLGSETGTLTFASSTLSGNASQIYRSRDRGRSWTRTPYVSYGVEPVTALWFFDAQEGIAVQPGAPSRLYVTTDGGRTWSAQAAPVPDYSMHFAPGGHGWGVMGGGLARSTDRGRTWQPQPSPGGDALRAVDYVHFLDARFGWAVVAGVTCSQRLCMRSPGEYRVTEDGGSTWAPRLDPALVGTVFDLAFLSPMLALRIDLDGTVHRSTNGGRDWTRVSAAALDGTGRPLGPLLVVDAALVFIAEPGGLLRSADGGLTWQAPTLPRLPAAEGTLSFGDIVKAGDGTLFATADRDLLLRSDDGGLTWTAQRTGTGLRLGAVAAADGRRVWLGGTRGAILATATGGR